MAYIWLVQFWSIAEVPLFIALVGWTPLFSETRNISAVVKLLWCRWQISKIQLNITSIDLPFSLPFLLVFWSCFRLNWAYKILHHFAAIDECFIFFYFFTLFLFNFICTVCEKVHPFYFCDYSVKCWPILIIFGNIATCNWVNLQRNDLFLSYNIQFVYEYYRIIIVKNLV